MSKFFTVLIVTLFPFSACGMEKEKRFSMHKGLIGPYVEEDKNAIKVIAKLLTTNTPTSEIIYLVKTQKININFHVEITGQVGYASEPYTILRGGLERCNPNVEKDVELIKLILLYGHTLKQESSKYWYPYLIYATENAINNNNNKINVTIVDLLIRHGANVNFRFVNAKKEGKSALHCALSYFDGDTTCIDYLLEKGADANACNSAGDTPLAILAERLSNSISSWKGKELPNFRLFELCLERLLEHGADINKTKMIYKVEKSDYDLLKPLIPNLEHIIKKVESKKKLPLDFKAAFEQNKQANRLIIIRDQTFNLNNEIILTRCPSLLHLSLTR